MRTTYENEKLAHHKSLFFIPGNAYYHKELTNAGAFASGALGRTLGHDSNSDFSHSHLSLQVWRKTGIIITFLETLYLRFRDIAAKGQSILKY